MFDSGNYTEFEASQPENTEYFINSFKNSTDSSTIYTSIFSAKLCGHWGELNHVYFQIANVFFFLFLPGAEWRVRHALSAVRVASGLRFPRPVELDGEMLFWRSGVESDLRVY